MQKDIIYIDVEDDITSIIGKVKDSKEKIVALVPPKRIGVLQSAVNLRLLARSATQNQKNLVIISSNGAMQSLAASAKIPVAKNLQSKPELGEIAALDIDDGDDIIDGASLPIGEHARMADHAQPTIPASAIAAAASVIDDAEPEGTTSSLPKAAPPLAGEAASKAKVKKGTKIPNFNKFRKKILIAVVALIVLIPALVWAIVFAPHATIYITAKTSNTAVNDTVSLAQGANTSASQKTLRSTQQQLQKNVSISFPATGTKNVGATATGTIVFSTNSIGALGQTIPAGTTLTSQSGKTYTTDSSVTISTSNYRGAPSSVTATAQGTSFNGASGSASGAPSGISASFQGSTSGGTDKTVTTVLASDVTAAQQQLSSQSTDAVKQQLQSQFDKNTDALSDTFQSDTSKVVSNPAVGAEVDNGNATLGGPVTYTMIGVAKSEIASYLTEYANTSIDGQNNQRVYNYGSSSAKLSNIQVGQAITVGLTANISIGPKIDDNAVKKAAEGKRFGDVQSSLSSIPGVSNVDVKFSPFWVNQVPNDQKRITIQFKLDDAK